MSQATEQPTTSFTAGQDGTLNDSVWTSQVPKSKPRYYIPATRRNRSITAQTDTKAKKEPRIPRPANSFLLFRTDFVSKLPESGISSGDKTLSRLAGDAWKGLSPTKRKYWEKKALEISEEHARKYPTWKYKPRQREGRPKRKVSAGQRRLEQSIITFHSRPEASTSSLPPAEVPPHLVHRKQSLRLPHWEDTVLAPIPTAPSSWYGNKEIPEVLRRRSSSVPLPEWPHQTTNASMQSYQYPLQTHLQPLHQPRLSYSGIRPGFVPMNAPPIGWMHQAQSQDAIDASLQSIPESETDPMGIFGSYQITYIPREGEESYRSQPPPISTSQELKPVGEYEPVEDSSPSSQSGFYYQAYHSSESVDNWNAAVGHASSTSTATVSPATGSNSNHSFQSSMSLPVTETKLEEASYANFLHDATETEHLIERMQSVDFGSSHPATHPGCDHSSYEENLKLLSDVAFFPNNNTPFSSFFPQYVQYQGSLQLTGLNADIIGAAIVDSQPKGPYVVYEDDDVNNRILNYPLSACESTNGSGGTSPLTDAQQLDQSQLQF